MSPDQRLFQTRETVDSLVRLGFKNIHIADNSGASWKAGTEETLRPAAVHVYEQHQFLNKGISELWLILRALTQIPDGAPILKISGRYTLNKILEFDDPRSQLAGRLYKKGRRAEGLTTRCYLVRDKSTLETFVHRTLSEIYGYGSRIVGPRSLIRVLRDSIVPPRDRNQHDPQWAIEDAAARTIRKYNYRFENKTELGIEGLLGGFERVLISE